MKPLTWFIFENGKGKWIKVNDEVENDKLVFYWECIREIDNGESTTCLQNVNREVRDWKGKIHILETRWEVIQRLRR